MAEDMKIRVRIGNRLRTIRKENRVTQETLAGVLDIKRETISMWENGVNCMDAETIVKLCEYFRVTPDYFLSAPKSNEDEFVMKLLSITSGFSEGEKENFLSLFAELAAANLTDFQFLLIRKYIGMIAQLSEADTPRG